MLSAHVHIIERLGWLMIYVIHMWSTCHLQVDTSSTHCLQYSIIYNSVSAHSLHKCTCTHDTQIWLVDNIHHPYVIHMSSLGGYVICTLSAALLMVTVVLNYVCTITGISYWMEFCHKNVELFHFRILEMICEIICVDGFLCMSHLDIVHMLFAYLHVIHILSSTLYISYHL